MRRLKVPGARRWPDFCASGTFSSSPRLANRLDYSLNRSPGCGECAASGAYE
jgi:hypothetical protein